MSGIKQKLTGAGKKLYWSAFDALCQRNFSASGYPVHYVWQKGKKNVLLVVFSAYASGLKPTYNYVRTLWGRTGCHLLFIRDDFVSIPSGGGYYLGRDGDFRGADAVCALIRHIREKSGCTRVIGVGSSKGGTAALLFGAKLGFDALIIGAPQYYIGTYMQEHKPDSLALLTGMYSPDAEMIARLDGIVPEAVRSSPDAGRMRVYLHYSDREHTYGEHISDMIRDLREYGFRVIEDVADYRKHTDVSLHYQPYLVRTLDAVLGERSDTNG